MMPILIPDSVREVLTAGKLAHLVTLESTGDPQISLVWVGLDDDQIVSAHLSGAQRKLRNMRGNPRVALSLETGVKSPSGLDEYLVVHGTASVTGGGAPELLQELAEVYIGPGVKFPPMDDPPDGFVTRITPSRFGGVGPWAG